MIAIWDIVCLDKERQVLLTGYTPSGSHKILNVDCTVLYCTVLYCTESQLCGKKKGERARLGLFHGPMDGISFLGKRYRKSITGKFGLKTIFLKFVTMQTKTLKKPLPQDNGTGYRISLRISLDFRFLRIFYLGDLPPFIPFHLNWYACFASKWSWIQKESGKRFITLFPDYNFPLICLI